MAEFVDPREFAARTRDAAKGAGELTSAVDKLGAEAAALKGDLDKAREALKSFEEMASRGGAGDGLSQGLSKARQDIGDLTSKLRDLKKAQIDALASALGGGNKGLDKAGDALGRGLADGEGHATAIGSALGGGAAALAWGAGELKAAAGWAWEKAKEGLEFGIKASAARSKQKEIFDALTHGQGEIALQVRTKLAGETAQDPAVVGAQMKRLIQAHFGRGETETLIKVAADISEVKEGAGERFLGALEKLEHRGKATERDLRAMAGAGIDLQRVLAELKGAPSESIEEVEARLKKGKVSADAFVGAATKIAKEDFGGLSGKGLDASINRAKIGLRGLFSGFDVSPLEQVAEKFAEVLAGPSGEGLKKSITEAANSVIHLADNISKEDIKTFFSEAGAAAKELAHDVKATVDGVTALAKAVGVGKTTKTESKGDVGRGQEDIVHIKRTVIPLLWYEEENIPKAEMAGKALDDGFAKGVEDNAPKIAAATKAAVKSGIDAANKEAGIRSPSTVAAEQGRYYDEGWEQGIDRHADRPAKAAARLARGVVGAGGAAGGSAIGGAPGGGESGGTFTYAPIYNISAGSSDEVVAAMRARDAHDYPRFLSMYRQAQRDRREGLTP